MCIGFRRNGEYRPQFLHDMKSDCARAPVMFKAGDGAVSVGPAAKLLGELAKLFQAALLGPGGLLRGSG